MSETWDPDHPKLVKSFPVVLDGRDGAVEVWRYGQWTYCAVFAGAAKDAQDARSWLPLELQRANLAAGEWIREQVADCPDAETECRSWQTDTGSGEWETESCLDCEQQIRAGHI